MRTIRQLRDERDWTQQQLADAVGAHWNSVARWERGDVMPDRQSRKLIALAFGLTVDDVDFDSPAEGKDAA